MFTPEYSQHNNLVCVFVLLPIRIRSLRDVESPRFTASETISLCAIIGALPILQSYYYLLTDAFKHDLVHAKKRILSRYVFPEERGGSKARLQEIGPRFTLKLKSLQTGAFDSNRGEYEWINLAENDKKKRKFAL
jgi:hypothetical protein